MRLLGNPWFGLVGFPCGESLVLIESYEPDGCWKFEVVIYVTVEQSPTSTVLNAVLLGENVS